jgi:hypothetical protein
MILKPMTIGFGWKLLGSFSSMSLLGMFSSIGDLNGSKSRGRYSDSCGSLQAKVERLVFVAGRGTVLYHLWN